MTSWSYCSRGKWRIDYLKVNVSFYLGLGLSLQWLNYSHILQQMLGGLAVRACDYCVSTPGSIPAHDSKFFFPLKLKRLAL